MRVTFCGTGGAGLSAARAGASIHVAYGDDQGADQTGGGQLLLDCGPGWLERFLAAGLAPERLDAVLLSHLHFDHAMGLGELLTRWAFEGFALPAILGPRDIEDYAGQALAFARTQHRYLSGRQLARLDAARIERVTPGEAMELAGARLRAVTVPHAPYLECLSWRVESGGATLVYSGDTRPAPEVMASQAAGRRCADSRGVLRGGAGGTRGGDAGSGAGGTAPGLPHDAQSGAGGGADRGGGGGATAGADAPAAGGGAGGAGGGGGGGVRG